MRRSRGRHAKSLPLRGHWLCGHPVLWYYLQVHVEVLQGKDVPVTLCHAELISREAVAWGSFVGYQ